MSLEHILLGMLREPASGYDLKTAFNEGARHFWSAELSQIYPALKHMQRRGWLTSRREPSPRGPDRRVYRRTAKGTEQLRRWLEAAPVVGTERFAYIGQLIFMGEAADLEVTERFMLRLRDRLHEFQRLLEAAEAYLRGRPDFPEGLDDHEFHELLSLCIGVRSLRAKVAACDENVELIRSRIRKGVAHA
jgi:DNA-binding PadR family transcriptional regulator